MVQGSAHGFECAADSSGNPKSAYDRKQRRKHNNHDRYVPNAPDFLQNRVFRHKNTDHHPGFPYRSADKKLLFSAGSVVSGLHLFGVSLQKKFLICQKELSLITHHAALLAVLFLPEQYFAAVFGHNAPDASAAKFHDTEKIFHIIFINI